MVDDARGRDGLACPGRALDHAQRLLQHALHRRHLRVVELGEARRREALRESAPDRLRLHLVAEEAMVEVARDGCLVDGERLHRALHSIVRCALPAELHREPVRGIGGGASRIPQLEGHLLGVGLIDNVADPAPLADPVRPVQLQLVSGHQPNLSLVLGEHEVGDALVVQPRVPVHHQILLTVLLLHSLVGIRLVLHERSEDVLVLVGIVVLCSHPRRLLVDPGLVDVFQARVRLGLPELLEFQELRGQQDPRPTLLVVGRRLDKPREERLCRVDEREPCGQVPRRVSLEASCLAACPAEQHNHLLLLRRDEAEHEDVALAAVVTLEHRLSERRIAVQRHLLELGADEVVDNARPGKLVA
mmetsp:Transcript_56047/g.132980  ORF Transcript_56047/g.132980 Transcript_56047/m.132980 type:complete len:360 (+) Transcript_56047:1840-2919(+)